MFRRFFSTVWFRCRLLWAVLCGHETAAYMALVEGRPVASRIVIHGTLEAGDGAMMQHVTVQNESGRGDGFRLGDNSFCYECVAAGWTGYGFNTAGNCSATVMDCPPVPDVFVEDGAFALKPSNDGASVRGCGLSNLR